MDLFSRSRPKKVNADGKQKRKKTKTKKKNSQACVCAHGPLAGRTLREVDFRRRYDAVALAVHRGGKQIPLGDLGAVRLAAGDLLVLEAGPRFSAAPRSSRAFVLATDVPKSSPPKKNRMWLALLLTALMVGSQILAGALKWDDRANLWIVATLTAGVMLGFGCVFCFSFFFAFFAFFQRSYIYIYIYILSELGAAVEREKCRRGRSGALRRGDETQKVEEKKTRGKRKTKNSLISVLTLLIQKKNGFAGACRPSRRAALSTGRSTSRSRSPLESRRRWRRPRFVKKDKVFFFFFLLSSLTPTLSLSINNPPTSNHHTTTKPKTKQQ